MDLVYDAVLVFTVIISIIFIYLHNNCNIE
jgi:hypothetical protein